MGATKTGLGPKLGGVLNSVDTAASSDSNNKDSAHINYSVYSHEKLSLRGNKSGNGTKLGNLATMEADHITAGPHGAVAHNNFSDLNTTEHEMLYTNK